MTSNETTEHTFEDMTEQDNALNHAWATINDAAEGLNIARVDALTAWRTAYREAGYKDGTRQQATKALAGLAPATLTRAYQVSTLRLDGTGTPLSPEEERMIFRQRGKHITEAIKTGDSDKVREALAMVVSPAPRVADESAPVGPVASQSVAPDPAGSAPDADNIVTLADSLTSVLTLASEGEVTITADGWVALGNLSAVISALFDMGESVAV